MRNTLIAAVLVIAQTVARAQDINTILMRSTFKVAGEGAIGTAFILGKPVPDTATSRYVLVTANHVFREMQGESVIIFLRKITDAGYVKVPFAIRIRDGAKELWTHHPTADIAVMYVRLPKDSDLELISTEVLATDEQMKRYELHPGDLLSCLGFPYGAEANDAGFPILRSGEIASFPLTPTSKYPTFLFDFRIFGGNSGGPVYLVASNRTYGGNVMVGETIQLLVGLVSDERVLNEEIKSLTETRRVTHQLSLAVVVASPLIRETIGLLPSSPAPN